MLDGKYVKGKRVQLAANFDSTEFDCHGSGCCTETLVDQKLVEYLQKIRDHFKKPVNISSGYRCVIHNSKPSTGGVTGSRHTKGQAADIFINGVAPAEIAKYAESIGVLGIGLYEKADCGDDFVHIDTRTTKSFWYGHAQAYRSTFGGAPAEKEYYRVRKSWEDSKSQVGAYTVLENAIKACKEAGVRYHVYDAKGVEIYPNKKIDFSKVNTSAADPKVVWDFLKTQGLNEYGIAGLMGNLKAESELRPCNLQGAYEKSLEMNDAEYTAFVDAGIYENFVNDKAGYGLAQWTYWTRKKALLEFHQARKKSIGDLNTQLAFLVKELSENYKGVWATLKNAKSVTEASNAVLLQYECPADQSLTVQSLRASYGQAYYDKYRTIPVVKEETEPMLQQGSKGEAVKRLQTKLNELGYNCGDVDGDFGPKTAEQVKAFQKDNNLEVDGIVGPLTWAKLKTAKKKFVPYQVKITATMLNYRSGPGMNYKINGVVRKNQIYTIVEEKGKWGKLKSGAGWIYLDYTKKV